MVLIVGVFVVVSEVGGLVKPGALFCHVHVNMVSVVLICLARWMPGACIPRRAQLLLGYSDLSSSTNPDRGNQDNQYPDVGYQLGNLTQVCLIKSHERTRIRAGIRGSRPIAIMSDKRTEKFTAERAPYFSCEEQRLILTKCEEEKSIILEKSNTVNAARRKQNAW